jgi:hypothetical protein
MTELIQTSFSYVSWRRPGSAACPEQTTPLPEVESVQVLFRSQMVLAERLHFLRGRVLFSIE